MATLKEEQSRMHGEKLSEAVKGGHVDAVPGDDKHMHTRTPRTWAVRAMYTSRPKASASRAGKPAA